MVLFHFNRLTMVHSCHASSFINPNKENGFTNKEENIHGIIQFIIQKREPSSHGLNVSPMNANTQMYNMWQPSLVLGRLGGALRVSMACKGPILALALQAF